MTKPLLLTRGIIIFPYATIDIEIGRVKSINAILSASVTDKKIAISCQKDINVEDPKFDDIYDVGTLCEITSILKNEDGSYKITVKGIKRIKISKINETKNMFEADVESLKENPLDLSNGVDNIKALLELLKSNTGTINSKELKQLEDSIINHPSSKSTPNIGKIVDIVANSLHISQENKQALLQELDLSKRIDLIIKFSITKDKEHTTNREIENKLATYLDKQQKEYLLREKIRITKEELGKINNRDNDINAFKKRIESNPYPEHIKKRVLAEIGHLDQSNQQESGIIRAYIEWLLDIPWWQTTIDNNDIKHVEQVLNRTHYGLEKVKERIIEYLAVRARSPQSKAPILCLVGPPGVGKSTLARSIAEALGKKFVKMALGGVDDEAEIRGHRKTYIGSMPGRIIKAMKSAGVVNPLFLLDELDKMGKNYRGDPASAMLEVLDPEQNNKFSDNYIEEDYDLSKVMFVSTANYADQIPAPLYDRLEIIELTSYTEREKLEIAKEYLIPKIRKEIVLGDNELTFDDEAILHIIRSYTQEAGVRELERLIQKIARKFIVKQQHKELDTQHVDKATVVQYLKKELYEYNVKEEKPIPGVVNGMAYTSAGGDLLPIEVTYFKGKGIINITGNLKETMKESAQVALGYVKANAEKFGIKGIDFNKIDIHIHVPSGGIPKDGPSAGVTLTTALISALSNRSVPNTIAMTGEITLRGRVGIIGGVKEKVISAFRGGVNEIFMPAKDERYLEDVPKEVASKINFHFVEHYTEIYKNIFNS